MLVRHGTLSLYLPRIATTISLVEEIMRLNTLILYLRIFNEILGEQTKPGRFSFIPYRFEETDPNLKMRVSGEVGVDPPHYVSVA